MLLFFFLTFEQSKKIMVSIHLNFVLHGGHLKEVLQPLEFDYRKWRVGFPFNILNGLIQK